MEKKLEDYVRNFNSLLVNMKHSADQLVELGADMFSNLVNKHNVKMLRFDDVASGLGLEYALPIFDPETKQCTSFKVVLEGGEYRTKLPTELSPFELGRVCYELVAINNLMEDDLGDRRVQVYGPDEERKQI